MDPSYGPFNRSVAEVREREKNIKETFDVTIKVAQDLLKSCTRELPNKELDMLKNTMVKLVECENDIRLSLNAARAIKDKLQNQEDEDIKIKEIIAKEKENARKETRIVRPEDHPRYQELINMINAAAQGDQEKDEDEEVSLDELDDSEIAVTQEEMGYLDPITKRPITDPVKNKHCGHSYDRDSILSYIRSRRANAKCPNIGCTNKNFLREHDLEENVKMKRKIERKKRMVKEQSRAHDATIE